MASEDVIELGSSEDEAEPATKKIKPVPNAMVHIPSKIHGVTIKPTRSNLMTTPKVLAGKNITVTKINNKNIVSNPYAAVNKINGKTLKRPTSSFIQPSKQLIPVKPLVNPLIQNRPVIRPVIQNRLLNNALIQNIPSVNPLNIIKNINSQVVINKVASGSRVLKTPIKIHSPKTINSLPPSITVTRTSGNLKRPGPHMSMNSVHKKQKINRIVRPVIHEVLTVDLDEEECSTSDAGPQWYLKPEDQNNMSAEEINNKEPEKPSYVEITIEDSPVKPTNKKTCEIGVELSVTIDDSPNKAITNKIADNSSDNEDDPVTEDKHSRKKLEYPKEERVIKTIEIEISPCMEHIITTDSDSKKTETMDSIIEIEESPIKIQGQDTSTPKKDNKIPNFSTTLPLFELSENDNLSEFQPVYQNFIKLCFQLENSDDMKKIVEKKIKTYYRQVPNTYTESEEFIDMVSSKIVAMKASPEKMYLYIKDIVDDLNLQRKMAKSQVLSDLAAKNSESEKFIFGDESEYDSKRQRQIRKLEKTLKKLHRAIQKLEEQEVDFDDDEDSVYLLTERYKERMVRVHAKFCQLTNTKMPSEPRVQIDARPGQPQGPAKKLEKWINKKVPIGTPLPFPDFHDVLRCVRESNEEDNLGWNEVDIVEEARDLFTRCGKKLQRRRQENEWRLAASRITVDVDPAEKSEDLKIKLAENQKVAAKRESEILNKFADRQNQLKLEAEEIGDKEAEESPVESDDDDNVDESSLQNKDKRKERLKRLIQEKSKKTTEVISDPANESSSEWTEKANPEKDKEEEKKSASTENITEETSIAANIEIVQTRIEEDTSEANKENQLSSKDLENNKLDDKNPNNNSDTTNTVLNSDIVCDIPKNDDNEKIHSLSDDSNKLESDIDELHLLQKLHSGNEINYTTSDMSSCDTPIAISDTLESSEDGKKQASGVISIENSSYSESEQDKNGADDNDDKQKNISEKGAETLPYTDEEMERCASASEKKIVTTNNDEYNESIEDILLASTDEETEDNNDAVRSDNEENCVNLKDDNISISETVVEEVENSNETNALIKDGDASSIESVTLMSTYETEKQEDTNSIESVKIVSINQLEKEEDVNSIDSVVSTNALEKDEDVKSIDSVTIVSASNVSTESDENKLANTMENNKQDDEPSTESSDILPNVNNDNAAELLKENHTLLDNTTRKDDEISNDLQVTESQEEQKVEIKANLTEASINCAIGETQSNEEIEDIESKTQD